MSGRGRGNNSKKLKKAVFSMDEDVYKYKRSADSKYKPVGDDVKKQDLWVEGIYEAMATGKIRVFFEKLLYTMEEKPKEEDEKEEEEKPKEKEEGEKEEEEKPKEKEEGEEEEEEEEEPFLEVSQDDFWGEKNTKMFKFLKRALSEYGEYAPESDVAFTDKDGVFTVYMEMDYEDDVVPNMRIRVE
jgi:hypothetical protein